MNISKMLFMARLLAESKAVLHKMPAQIRMIQDEKLRRLLHYTWAHSPYYRDMWQQDMLESPLSQLPAITKAELLGALAGLLLSCACADRIISRIVSLFGIGVFHSEFSLKGYILPVLAVTLLFTAFTYLGSGKLKRFTLA